MRTIEFDEKEWDNEELKLFRNGKPVDTIFLDDLVKNWMQDMEKKGFMKYKEVV